MLIFISGWGRGMVLNRAKNLIKLTEGEVHLIYPDDKWVSEEKIMGWAEDAFADGDIDHKPENLEDAIEMLNDAGIITTHKAWWKKSHHEDLWPASKPGFSPGISATTQLIPEQGKDWIKQAQEKARWAIEYGKTKGYTSIVQDGMEVLKMIRDGLDQSDVLRSNAYQTAVKVWGK